MLNKPPTPSTIGGIKRYAKQLKRAEGITHTAALTQAAKHASFENYDHALRVLNNNSHELTTSPVFFVAYWYDYKKRRYGREVLEVKLSKSLLSIAPSHELKHARHVGHFRQANTDLLVMDELSESQESARRSINKAARELDFMVATGLVPNKDTTDIYPDRNYENKLPGADHTSSFRDPVSGQCIVVDEPYPEAISHNERVEWARKHNWHYRESQWEGIYYPGMSKMFVTTDASTGYDFNALMEKIDSISTQYTDENWAGSSINGHDTFISPSTSTSIDKKRAKAKGTIFRVSTDKTIPMKSWNDPTNERRPNSSMAVNNHQKVARLIKAAQTGLDDRYEIHERLSSIKSKLEDWFFKEHDKSVTNNYDLFYYGSIDTSDPLVIKAKSSEGVVVILREIRDILVENYIDCAPLRKMLKKLDYSIEAL